jgi:hypothetical protein
MTATGRDCAVMMACDANYLPYALHLAWQMHGWSPGRGFDILIVTDHEVTLPGWAQSAGIRHERLSPGPAWSAVPHGPFGPAVYLALSAVQQLSGRYRRILKLDSDIWFEGGDLDRLLRLDLGHHPFGAVLDVMNFHAAFNTHAREFRDRGLPERPYFNSGVILFDTAACVAQDLEQRLLNRARAEGDRLWLADQTLLNLVVAGDFAQLSPVWNWVSGAVLPLVTHRFPIRFRHFIGREKPWRDPAGVLDARYAAGYQTFFRTFLPEAEPLIPPWPSAPLGFREVGRIVLDNLKSQGKVDKVLSRFPDEWHVEI